MGRLTYVAGLVVIALVLAAQPVWSQPKESKRNDVKKMTNETLARLYKVQPTARKSVEGAAGYAVFSNFGMKIFVAGGGSGTGMAVNNQTKKATYMKMMEVQAGLGMGIKKFRLVWVFESQALLNKFINSGWEIGGQTSVAAQMSGQGASFAGAISISPGVWLYQLTDDGLAVELTAKGTKYYKDSDLN
jgi:lipid-binding SYLF domain-containing protein